jgi:ABC-type transporter Mla subunit MlaD
MEIYVAILTGCAVLTLLTFFAVAFRIWLVCRQAELFFAELNLKLPPALEELRDTAEKINSTADIIRDRVADTDRQFASVVQRFMSLSQNLLQKCNRIQEYFSTSKLKGLALLPAAYKIYQSFFSSQKKQHQTQEGDNNG